MVEDADSLDGVSILDEFRNFRIHKDFCPVELGVHHIRGTEPERIHGTVRHFHRPDDRRIHRWLHPDGLLRIHHLCLDACSVACLYEGRLIVEVILRQGYEQSGSVVHAMAGDLLQDNVLLDAFGSRFPVGNGITGPAVQKPVIPSGSPGGNVIPLHQQGAKPSESAVPRSSGTGDASAYDDDIKFVHSFPVYCFILILRLLERLTGS